MISDDDLDDYVYFSPDVGIAKIKDNAPIDVIERIRKYDIEYFKMMKTHYVYDFHVEWDGDKNEEYYRRAQEEWRAEHGDEPPGKEWQE